MTSQQYHTKIAAFVCGAVMAVSAEGFGLSVGEKIALYCIDKALEATNPNNWNLSVQSSAFSDALGEITYLINVGVKPAVIKDNHMVYYAPYWVKQGNSGVSKDAFSNYVKNNKAAIKAKLTNSAADQFCAQVFDAF